MLRGIWCLLVSALLVLTLGVMLIVVNFIRRSDGLNDWVMRVWAVETLRAAGVDLIVEGGDRVPAEAPCFFVGNHQSAMDIPSLLVARRGRVRFLAKESLFRIPLFGWTCKSASHLSVSRTRPRVTLERLEKLLRQIRGRPVSLAVFPEGTRSPDGRLLPFHKGTMKICRRAGLTVVPFAVSGSLAVHERGNLRVCPGTVRIRFGMPIRSEEVSALSVEELHDRVYEAVASDLDLSPAMSGAMAS